MATSRTGLGYPAVPTPRPDDWKGVANSISNARQRIEAIEAAITAAANTATGASASTNDQITALQKQIVSLTQLVANLGNAATIDTTPYIAGEALGLAQGVVSSGGSRVVAADASDPLRMFGLIGITTGAAPVGGSVVVQRRGPFDVVGASFEAGRAVYVGDGGLTQTPNYEATAIPAGVAISATAIYVAPDWPALRGPPIASAVGDTFLKFLPVTYSLISDLLDVFGLLESQAPGLAIWSGTDLVTDPTVLPVLPSGGLNGTEIIVVERDGITVHTTVREIWLYVQHQLSVSG